MYKSRRFPSRTLKSPLLSVTLPTIFSHFRHHSLYYSFSYHQRQERESPAAPPLKLSTMSNPTGTVLVTGGTTGLGYGCALKIAQQCPQYQVLIASRSNKDNAAVSINEVTGHSNVEYLKLDLSSLAKVRSFAADYAKKGYPPMKALVLNAGLQILDLGYTEDKIESTFAINHVGHALLFYLMRPFFAEEARIVIVASGTQYVFSDSIFSLLDQLLSFETCLRVLTL